MRDLFGIQETDRLFQDSPDAGQPECICSRCGKGIAEADLPIRIFVDEGRGGEYRYHPKCLGLEVEADVEADADFHYDDLNDLP